VLLCAYAVFLATAEHVYEGAYVKPRSKYCRTDAAVAGSSCIIMPWWWRWASFGIEYHHIHHLNPRVPGYRIKVSRPAAPALTGIRDKIVPHTLQTTCNFILKQC